MYNKELQYIKNDIFTDSLSGCNRDDLHKIFYLVTVIQYITQRRPFDLTPIDVMVNLACPLDAFQKILENHLKVIGGKLEDVTGFDKDKECGYVWWVFGNWGKKIVARIEINTKAEETTCKISVRDKNAIKI